MASNYSSNIWDSSWKACTQATPPSLSEILGAYAQKGDGDREMLLGILNAKSSEDQRIAALANLHQTILQMQLQAQRVQLTSPPSISMEQHLAFQKTSQSYQSGGLPSPSSIHSPPTHATSPQASSSRPVLPPIHAMQNGRAASPPPKKRSRRSSSSSTSSGHSSERYPLSPYSNGSGRSPPHRSTSRSVPYPSQRDSQHKGGMAIDSLLEYRNRLSPSVETGHRSGPATSAERTTS
ncbi:hypothetical protein FRC03_008331 [Tulasnella sp. 419]|nr:hypothetical protein FRC02_001529 [Tulasnella sp. 418]KAG8968196.1 hypothetical protein FRC03_008331 [Tulasnella sp. 419]